MHSCHPLDMSTNVKILDKISKKTSTLLTNAFFRLIAYLKRLLFPIYLFPIKLVTYTAYYLVKFTLKFLMALIKLIGESIIFPFRSLKNLIKSLLLLLLGIYIIASLFVILDYLRTQYGHYGKFLCSFGTRDELKKSVVRIVGGYSEGSGFFIESNQILTNFHVIANEPSPKIILPNGNFLTPTKIVGDRDADLAIIYVDERYPDLVFPLPDEVNLYEEEPLISTGYPLGTSLNGAATSVNGNFDEYRKNKSSMVGYLQTNITIVKGMSGGPLTDKCGKVVGINTMGLSGLSFFISADWAKLLVPTFTDQHIKKIDVDPTKSPEDAVRAFYTYLKARRMQDGFNLLSNEYLKNTSFEEWTNRFKDILHVDVFKSERYQNTDDTAFVKFSTKNWVDNEAEVHYYEGTWVTVPEDGVYKMHEANIKEVDNPSWVWFYE